MKRKIIFRAKRIDNGKWVYGDLLSSCLKPHIYIGIIPGSMSSLRFDIEEETIGQFTGLCDKNQKPIFEGDIVLQQGYHGKEIPMVVKFECGAFIVGYHEGSSTKRRPMLLNSRCKVVGNIFDNPNLIN